MAYDITHSRESPQVRGVSHNVRGTSDQTTDPVAKNATVNQEQKRVRPSRKLSLFLIAATLETRIRSE